MGQQEKGWGWFLHKWRAEKGEEIKHLNFFITQNAIFQFDIKLTSYKNFEKSKVYCIHGKKNDIDKLMLFVLQNKITINNNKNMALFVTELILENCCISIYIYFLSFPYIPFLYLTLKLLYNTKDSHVKENFMKLISSK